MCEAIRADHDVLTVVAYQITVVAAVDVVPLERDPARQRQVDVGLLAADQVAADAPHPGEMTVFRRPADDADVRAVGTVRRLNRIAGDGPLADGPALRAVDVNLGGRHVGRLEHVEGAVVVVLDVVAGDLQVANLTVLDADAAESAVADVIANDVRLVQVDPVHPDADAGVVIEVAVTDEDVAAAFGEMNGVSYATNQDAS